MMPVLPFRHSFRSAPLYPRLAFSRARPWNIDSDKDALSQTTDIRRPQLRELVCSYRPKIDSNGRPVLLGPTLKNPTDAARVLATMLANESVELFGMLCLTTRRRVICWCQISRGRLNGVHVEPREVFQTALMANARSVILAHNHPSGEPHASPDDFHVTRRRLAAGRLLGVDVLDHIIIGDDRFVSLRVP